MDEELKFTFRKNKADEKYGTYIKFQYSFYKTTDTLVNNIINALKNYCNIVSVSILCSKQQLPQCQDILVFFELPCIH